MFHFSNAFFDEKSPDNIIGQRIAAYEALSPQQVRNIENKVLKIKRKEIDNFISELNKTITRTVSKIIIVAIHGNTHEVNSIDAAIKFIQTHKPEKGPLDILGFNIFIRYNNGDKIDANFQNKEKAVDFLNIFK